MKPKNKGEMFKSIGLFVVGFLLLVAFYLHLANPSTVLAQEPAYDQVNDIAKQLNCPTCVGINLADCRTQTCTQWRDQINDLLQQGYSKQEVLDYFVAQYGAQVLQEPPKSGFSLALWLLPIIALLAGGGWLFYVLRGWSNQARAPGGAPFSGTNVAGNSPSPKLSELPAGYLNQVEEDLGIEEV